MVSKEQFCANPTNAFKEHVNNNLLTDDNPEFAEMTAIKNKNFITKEMLETAYEEENEIEGRKEYMRGNQERMMMLHNIRILPKSFFR